MSKLILEGYIGYGYASSQYIKSFLDSNKGKEVTLVMSSFGGDYHSALKIRDHIATHGNVIIEYHAFNASSATVISLHAKKIRAEKSSFYLAHKVLTWIDEWGYKNEDDLEQVIENLSNIKDNAQKITLGLANAYAKKTGKGVGELLALMKKESWLSADEAKEWGFIDEVFEIGEKEQVFDNNKLVAAVAASGLPAIPRKHENNNQPKENNVSEESEKRIADRVTKTLKGLFNNNSNNKTPQKMPGKTLAALCGLLAVNAIEVDEKQGAYINQEQLNAINDKLKKFDEMENSLTNAQTELETATNTIAERDETITQLNEEVAELKDEPGEKTPKAKTKGDDAPSDKSKTVAKGENDIEDISAVTTEYFGGE